MTARSIPKRYSLKDLAAMHGVDALRITVPLQPIRSVLGLVSFTSSSDEAVPTECVVTERRYKVADGYKIELVSANPDFHGVETYYQSDLESLLNSDTSGRDYKMRVIFPVGGIH